MIIDLGRFVSAEEPHWLRLEALLERRAKDPWAQTSLAEARELDYLYRRAAADLVKVTTFSGDSAVRERLERMVAHSYAEIHGARRSTGLRFRPMHWLMVTFPQAFRRRLRPLALAIAVTLAGMLLGGLAMAVDPAAKQVLMPFPHLLVDPAQRVAEEERPKADWYEGRHGVFAAELMTHNTEVSLFALAFGILWGFGTTILVFYNGVTLGAVVMDYIMAGQTKFMLGWLLPHGVIEIPAILVAAQAGYVLAGAMLSRDRGQGLGARLRAVADDAATLAGGMAVMLVWAGLVEAFVSQYHEPAVPYELKIALGLVEAFVLVVFLAFAGRKEATAGA